MDSTASALTVLIEIAQLHARRLELSADTNGAERRVGYARAAEIRAACATIKDKFLISEPEMSDGMSDQEHDSIAEHGAANAAEDR